MLTRPQQRGASSYSLSSAIRFGRYFSSMPTNRIASTLALASAFVLLLVADGCGGEAKSAASANRCGVAVFASPTCENAVNYMCCTQKADCESDPACAPLAKCMFDCKHQPGDACRMACGTKQTPSPETQRGLARWQVMIDCVSRANVPNCGDDS